MADEPADRANDAAPDASSEVASDADGSYVELFKCDCDPNCLTTDLERYLEEAKTAGSFVTFEKFDHVVKSRLDNTGSWTWFLPAECGLVKPLSAKVPSETTVDSSIPEMWGINAADLKSAIRRGING